MLLLGKVTYTPQNCHCVVTWIEPLNESRMTLKERCRTHNTAQEVFVHERSFSTRTIAQKDTEKAKQEFQRR